jgi:hypothetical protein
VDVSHEKHQRRIIGLRLRLGSGRKLSVKGGREGLFTPSGLEAGGRLLIAEGPTDVAVLLGLGFQAVGRPSCTGGVKHLTELVKRFRPEEAVIGADRDQPGQRGADRLAATLAAHVPMVKVITPPAPFKDMRIWRQAGATAADVLAAADAAPVRRLRVTTRRKGRTWTATARATA